MLFSEYMQSLPNQRKETIKHLAELTCSTTASVYRWMSGESYPSPIKQKLIAEFLGMPIADLFPPEKTGGES